MRRLGFLVRKEFQELKRNPGMIRVLLFAPVFQLVVMGYAATTDVKNVPTVVVDADRSPASRDLIGKFEGSPYFSVVAVTSRNEDVNDALEHRTAWMALSIPAGYGKAIAGGTPVTVQVITDGTDSNSAGVGLAYAGSLIAEKSVEIAVTRRGAGIATGQGVAPGLPAGGQLGTLSSRTRVWFNPELLSQQYMVPGVLALLLMITTGVLGAVAIVREKELGTLEQLNVTPLRRWELTVGKLLPYGLLGVVQVFLVVGVAVFWFQIPLRGSFPLLFGLSLVYLLCTLGLGLLVSTVSSTQQQAMMTAAFFFMIPMIMLSGFIFPIENMPAIIQPITYLIPLRYFLVIVRGVFLKGVGLESFWPEALAMLAWGLTVMTLATMRSRKTLR